MTFRATCCTYCLTCWLPLNLNLQDDHLDTETSKTPFHHVRRNQNKKKWECHELKLEFSRTDRIAEDILKKWKIWFYIKQLCEHSYKSYKIVDAVHKCPMYVQSGRGKKDEKHAFLSALPCSFANIQCKQLGGKGYRWCDSDRYKP